MPAGYLFTSSAHGTFSPDGKVPDAPPVDVDTYNKATEARELAHWKTAPEYFCPAYFTIDERPDVPRDYVSWVSRVDGRPVTLRTWLGTVIGHGLITGAHTNNFGARVVRLRVLGTNGAEYWGAASYDAEIIRLHKVRS